jgi:hypothetical protein
LLGLRIFLDDLRVVCIEDMPRRRLLHAAARIALDTRDQATSRTQGVLLGRRGFEARRLAA